MHKTQMKMDMMVRDMRWSCVLGTWHDVSTRPSHVRSEKPKRKKGPVSKHGQMQMSGRGAEQDAKDTKAIAG